MTVRNHNLAAALAAVLLSVPLFAQSIPPAERVVRISGAVPAAAGEQATLHFAIFDANAGGELLWQETQVVTVDTTGNYTAFLGAMSSDGLPLDVFSSGAPRWLAVEGPSGPLGPRTLLAAVPYAVAAATATNATSLAGRPASDFQLTAAARRKDQAAATTTGAKAGAAAANLDGPAVTSGTANFIGKFTNSVDLGNSQLFDNGTNVGVSTTSPLDKFHVQFTNNIGTITGYAVQNLGSTTGAYSGMLFYDHTGTLRQFQGYNNGTGEYRINNISPTGSINFMIGSTSGFLVDTARNVGIGQTSPAYKLDVLHGGSTGIRIKSTSSFSVLDIDAVSGDAAIRLAANGVNQWNLRNRPADNYLEIFELGGGGSRVVVQDGTGNVGIGETTNPTYRLDVLHGGSTGARIRSSASFSVLDIDAFSGDAAVRFIDNGVNKWNLRNQPGTDNFQLFQFGGGGERFRVDNSTGNVNIGDAVLTTTKLSVAGDVHSEGDFKPLGTTFFGMRWVDASGVIQAHIHRFGASDNRLYITNNGAGNLTGVYLASGATSITSTSDERLKRNIRPMTGLLDKIKGLRVASYDMANVSAGEKGAVADFNTMHHEVGSIAQDWLKDFPELVVKPDNDQSYYGLNYDRIGVVALGAVKELNAVVEQKDAEIKALNDRIAALEAAIKSLTTTVQQQR